jgi:hypothetical protein
MGMGCYFLTLVPQISARGSRVIFKTVNEEIIVFILVY